jgi:hypothetical protein
LSSPRLPGCRTRWQDLGGDPLAALSLTAEECVSGREPNRRSARCVQEGRPASPQHSGIEEYKEENQFPVVPSCSYPLQRRANALNREVRHTIHGSGLVRSDATPAD